MKPPQAALDQVTEIYLLDFDDHFPPSWLEMNEFKWWPIFIPFFCGLATGGDRFNVCTSRRCNEARTKEPLRWLYTTSWLNEALPPPRICAQFGRRDATGKSSRERRREVTGGRDELALVKYGSANKKERERESGTWRASHRRGTREPTSPRRIVQFLFLFICFFFLCGGFLDFFSLLQTCLFFTRWAKILPHLFLV